MKRLNLTPYRALALILVLCLVQLPFSAKCEEKAPAKDAPEGKTSAQNGKTDKAVKDSEPGEWREVSKRLGLSVGHVYDKKAGVSRFKAVNKGAAARWRLVRYKSDEIIDLGLIPAGKTIGGYDESNTTLVTKNAGTWIKEVNFRNEWIKHSGTHCTH